MNVQLNNTLKTLATAAIALGLYFAAQVAFAQIDCKHRGELDALYCDENKDLVADPPKDARRHKNPSTLVFAYNAVEEPAVYEKLFGPFMNHLGTCTGKRVTYYKAQSSAAEIDAMRSGRLHVGGFSTGSTNFAVNLAGAIPFAAKGTAQGWQGYTVLMLVRKDSPYLKITDLKGKKIAHVQPSSNSGNFAPRAFFPAMGLTPDQDYKVVYSGKHDNSILGVSNGNYDAAPVASTVFHRMAARGQVKEDDFRIIWRSEIFPTTSFAYAHDLEPKLRDKLLKCFYDYRFPATMSKEFDAADRFFPISYIKDWAVVRKVAEVGAEKFNNAAFDALKKKELEAAPPKSNRSSKP